MLCVVEDDAEDDVGCRAVLLNEVCGVEDAGHATGEEVDIVGRAFNQLRVDGGAVDKLVDAFTQQLMSRASGRESWLGGILVIIKWNFDQGVNLVEQMLCNADGESKTRVAPAKHEGFGMLWLKNHSIDAMAGNVDTLEGQILRVNGKFITVGVLDVAGSVWEHYGVEVDHAALALDAQFVCYCLTKLYIGIWSVIVTSGQFDQ